MVFGNFESPSTNNEKKEQSDNQAEITSVEESVGKNSDRYRDADNIVHNTFPIRNQLDKKTLEKLEKIKQEQAESSVEEQDQEQDSGRLKDAA
jgi:hypothetical protein